jgi:hypothetical protein
MKNRSKPVALPSIEECLQRVEQIYSAERGQGFVSAEAEINRSIKRASIFALRGDNANATVEMQQAEIRIQTLRDAGEPLLEITVGLQRAAIFAIEGKPIKTRRELRSVVRLLDIHIAEGTVDGVSVFPTESVAGVLLNIATITAILENQLVI